MNDLVSALSVLGKPYKITKSKLGAITKVYTDEYMCDLLAIKELVQSVGEKISAVDPIGIPEFSFVISFDDRTHRDGVMRDLQNASTIPTGKRTDRVVMRWSVQNMIDGEPNELAVTVRLSNPINPLVFLQAALSKSPSDVDNFEFEMGSTCVTVDGADQGYSEEVFLRVHQWIKARYKPHAFINLHGIYKRYEWFIDQMYGSLLPFFMIWIASYELNSRYQKSMPIATPLLVCGFFILHSGGSRINEKMSKWASRTKHISLFQITNGDVDFVTKLDAAWKNSALKLLSTALLSLVLNIIASVICYRFLRI